ncbi:MAG: Txe/YoeB family addiction module toxin [Prevotella sp.]|nr:Txe/YoeB family addiction module toxin [Prevotella sp.]MBR6445263.1 Txe/YoeB family addiction module toxin [Prevotella sp.]
MSKYFVDIKAKAQDDLKRLKANEPKAYRKALRLIGELYDHPRTGTGKPEQLSGDRSGEWSRRITKKHRLVYEINDREVVVLVLTAYGHYDDK